MKLHFISQASTIVETADCVIWTDPWLFDKAFNDSWELFPKPRFDESWYDKITHLWISHEHPDHFHLPTLKSLPTDFKQKVVLLFQDNHCDKMPNSFQKLGFCQINLLKNRKITNLTATTKVHNCQIGQMDSSLAIITPNYTLLNLNDCEVNTKDCKNYVKDLGKIDIVLNQFSMAGYNGNLNYQEQLQKDADKILQNMLENHRDLKASTTIPFASNIYFCCEDNKFINDFSNTPQKVFNKFQIKNLDCKVMYPGESIDVASMSSHDSLMSMDKFDELYATKDSIVYNVSEQIPLKTIEKSFLERRTQLKKYFPTLIINKLGRLNIYIPDLQKNVQLSIAQGIFQETKLDQQNFDLQIHSQPLEFAFRFKWGIQTLGVSARYFIKNNHSTWRWYRIVSSMNNAEFYLKLKHLICKKNMYLLTSRASAILNQLLYQLSRMKD